MDSTLRSILRELYLAHSEVDALRAKVAELEAALNAQAKPPEPSAGKGKAA